MASPPPEDFQTETRNLMVRQAKLMAWLSLLMLLLFCVTDSFLNPSKFMVLFELKLIPGAWLCVGILLLNGEWGQRRAIGLSLSTCFAMYSSITLQSSAIHDSVVVPTVCIFGTLFASNLLPWGVKAQTIFAGIAGTAVIVNALLVGGTFASAFGYGQVAAYGSLLASVYLARKFHHQRFELWRTTAALRAATLKADHLLANVLPAVVIPRLKANDGPIADEFADVTVLFADIVGFTPLSERLGPKRIMRLLDRLFLEFDAIASNLGVEKIETVGDGYLASGGAPAALENHPRAVAQMAIAMIAATVKVADSHDEPIAIRVGIHTGPILAGIVGKSRFHYKIFGATVNTASRVQGQSAPGRILVSEVTYKRIQAEFVLQERGEVELKGHGPMRTWWLTGPSTVRQGAAFR